VVGETLTERLKKAIARALKLSVKALDPHYIKKVE
jgi:hypothetical protein